MQQGKIKYGPVSFITITMILFNVNLCIAQTEDKINIKVNYVAKLNEISKPANYDPNLNAAPYYEKAFELLADMPNDIKDLSQKWPGDMNDTELRTTKDFIESNSKVLNYLKQAAQKPYYWIERQAKHNNLLEIEYSELKRVRHCTYLLVLQAKLMANQGQIKPALKQIVDIYKIGTHFGPPKILIDQLVGIAISANALQAGFQIFDRTEPNPDSLKIFQQQLEGLSASRKYVIDFTAEKLVFYDQVQRLFTDDGRGNGHIYGTAFLENPVLYFRQLFAPEKYSWIKTSRKETIELANKMFDYFNWAREKSPAQLYKEGEDLDKTTEEMVKDHYLLKIFTPAIGRVLQISYRFRVHTDGLLTTVGILRYKADVGDYPQKLSELASGSYIKGLPIDPFSGNQLVYKRVDSDFMLYSFAHDFDDDGGKHDPKWAKDGDGDYVFWPINKKQK